MALPLFKAKPGDPRLDKATGELRTLRAEQDAALHFERTGETAWGTEWVVTAVRSRDVHGRMILDVDHVPSPGGEAATALGPITGLLPLCPLVDARSPHGRPVRWPGRRLRAERGGFAPRFVPAPPL